MIVLGIDPGTTTTGYAIVEKKGNSKILIDFGVILTTPKNSFEDKILEIIKDLEKLIKKYKPEKAVIEKIYFTKNIKTAIDVVQARGVIIYKIKLAGIKIEEYTPLQLKSAICSNGKANKLQLQKAIKIFFGLDNIPAPDDAADAIGLAYMGILKN